MILAIALAAAYAAGLDVRRLAVLVATVYVPYLMAVVILVFIWRGRSLGGDRSALFCESVASELRAGATLRHALQSAVTSVGDSSSLLSSVVIAAPMTEVAASLAERFPDIGEELRLVVASAYRSGSDSAALFDEIGSLAIAQSEIRREVKVATAPGKATALVLVGAPLVYVVYQVTTGAFGGLLETSSQRLVGLAGFVLFGLGLAIAGLVIWRAGR